MGAIIKVLIRACVFCCLPVLLQYLQQLTLENFRGGGLGRF